MKSPAHILQSKMVEPRENTEFSSKVAAHIPKEKRRKLDKKSETGIFVGYGEETKGYRVYFSQRNKVEILRNVIFLPETPTKVLNIVSEDISQDMTPEEDENIEAVEVGENREAAEVDEGREADEAERHVEDSDSDNEEPVEIPRTRREVKEPLWLKDYETNFYTFSEEPTTYEGERVRGVV